MATLSRALHKWGYQKPIPYTSPFLSRASKVARLKFAQQYQRKTNTFWRQGIYTDESSFSTRTLRRQRVWRQENERYNPDCIQWTFHSGRSSVMMWAAIGYNFKGPLHILVKEKGHRGIDAEAYRVQVLERSLAEIQAQHPQAFVVEDNAPIHGRKKKTSRCNEARCIYHIHSIDWPPSSPDLNPIEWIWRWMKQRLRGRRPCGGWKFGDLTQAIYEVWDELQVEDYQKIIDSMPTRLQEVWERGGGQTQY